MSATIVREQHDLDQINFDLPDWDQQFRSIAGVWDAREMGISLEEAETRIRAADTPAARQQVLSDLRSRAIQRASLDVTDGQVSLAYAGELPWHGLGVGISQAMTSEEAIKLSGLSKWKVEKARLSYTFNGKEKPTEQYALVRNDTGYHLGTVGPVYKPIQNQESFDFLDGVLKEHGAKYEVAGAVYGGKQIFLVAQMPKYNFTVNGSDEQKPYVLFTNSHDGLSSALCFPVEVRPVCANTLRVAVNSRSGGISIRHTGNLQAKIASAQQALGLAVSSFNQYKEAVEVLTRTKLDSIESYTNRVLDKTLEISAEAAQAGYLAFLKGVGLTEEDLTEKQFNKKVEKRFKIFEDILERYENDRNGIGGMRGTAWSGLNAVTEFADHNKIRRYKGTAIDRMSRHFESVISGNADEMKQSAFELALALAA